MKPKQLKDDNEENIVNVEFEDVTETELDKEDELASILKEIGADTAGHTFEMRVYRIPRTGGKLAWLFDCDPTLSVFEKLRDEYGGGNFELRVYKGNRIFKRPRIEIEPPKVARLFKAPHENNLSENDIVNLISKSQEKFFDKISNMFTPPPVQPVQNPVSQMTEMLTLMNTMKEFTSGNSEPRPDTLAQIKEVLELKKLLGGNSEGETSGSDVIIAAIEHLGGPFAELVQQAQVEQSQAVQQNARPVRQQVNKKEEVSTEMFGLKMGLKMMVSAAATNEDPAPYVDIIFQKLGTEDINKYLMQPNALEELIKINQQIMDYRPWFEELRELVSERVNDETKVEVKDSNSSSPAAA